MAQKGYSKSKLGAIARLAVRRIHLYDISNAYSSDETATSMRSCDRPQAHLHQNV